jgi:hypothetical protein
MIWRWGLALVILAGALVVPQPAAAQQTDPECRTARQLVRRLAPREPRGPLLVSTGWMLTPPPWIPGLAPYPYPYVPAGWRLVSAAEVAATPEARLARALRSLAERACSGGSDAELAARYAEVVSVLGYLQGDVADALEQPAREILTASDSERVRELALAILAAVATLRRGGGP